MFSLDILSCRYLQDGQVGMSAMWLCIAGAQDLKLSWREILQSEESLAMYTIK